MKKSAILYILLFLVMVIIYENRLIHTFLHYGTSVYHSYFINQLINVSYSKIEIPKNWYVINQNDNRALLAGPPFQITGERVYMKIYKNMESIAENFFYMDDFCLNIDDEIQIKNITSFISNDSRELVFQGDILFCQKSIALEKSYVVFHNLGLTTLITIEPYQQEFKEQYLRLFKSLKFQTNKSDLPPSWLMKRLEE